MKLVGDRWSVVHHRLAQMILSKFRLKGAKKSWQCLKVGKFGRCDGTAWQRTSQCLQNTLSADLQGL